MLNPLKLEVEGSSVNMANNVGENCYIVKHLTNNLTDSFIRCLYVKIIKYTKTFMFISCICILYSTKHQMTFVDNKSKKVNTAKKNRGIDFVIVVSGILKRLQI